MKTCVAAAISKICSTQFQNLFQELKRVLFSQQTESIDQDFAAVSYVTTRVLLQITSYRVLRLVCSLTVPDDDPTKPDDRIRTNVILIVTTRTVASHHGAIESMNSIGFQIGFFSYLPPPLPPATGF